MTNDPHCPHCGHVCPVSSDDDSSARSRLMREVVEAARRVADYENAGLPSLFMLRVALEELNRAQEEPR